MTLKDKLKDPRRPCEHNVELGDPILWIKSNGVFVMGPAYEISQKGVQTLGQGEKFFAEYSEIIVIKFDGKGEPDYLMGRSAQKKLDNEFYMPGLN